MTPLLRAIGELRHAADDSRPRAFRCRARVIDTSLGHNDDIAMLLMSMRRELSSLAFILATQTFHYFTPLLFI